MIFSAYYLTGSKTGKKLFEKYNSKLEKIIPDLIEITGDGSLVIKKSDLPQNKKIFPMIQNQHLSGKITASFLKQKTHIIRAVRQLLSFLNQSEYLGLNIDLEGVKKENKSNYNFFIEKLAKEMKKRGYTLDLSIPAKTENHVDTGWAGAYDYNFLGSLADNVFIMAYDYHWPGGTAGPIAPLDWVYNVIDYVIMEISPEKVVIGMPGYGYDWLIEQSVERAKGLSYKGVLSILDNKEITPEWDQESEAPYFSYRDSSGLHEVWYENEASLKKKWKLIKRFQVKGAALWRLGLEDQRFWNHI